MPKEDNVYFRPVSSSRIHSRRTTRRSLNASTPNRWIVWTRAPGTQLHASRSTFCVSVFLFDLVTKCRKHLSVWKGLRRFEQLSMPHWVGAKEGAYVTGMCAGEGRRQTRQEPKRRNRRSDKTHSVTIYLFVTDILWRLSRHIWATDKIIGWLI